jgi:opacity protein-like surface antigen
MLSLVLAMGAGLCAAGQTAPSPAAQPAPPAASAPASGMPAKPVKPPRPYDTCDIKNAGASMVATGGLRAVSALGVGETSHTAGSAAVQSKVCSDFAPINWYDRFVTGPDVMRFSPEQKFRLAVTNIVNPFNLGTIVGEAGIEIAANSHTSYGPGVYGWAKLSGTNFTQDMTDQFFGTFLIPAITHTDPHYHRRPDLSIPHRIWHCVDQIVWQRDDSGGHTFNYSQIVAPVFDIAISNLYVPGLRTHLSADAERYGVGLATAPIDNFITEFAPSIASHIHTHVVFVQRVINQVAVNPP